MLACKNITASQSLGILDVSIYAQHHWTHTAKERKLISAHILRKLYFILMDYSKKKVFKMMQGKPEGKFVVSKMARE